MPEHNEKQNRFEGLRKQAEELIQQQPGSPDKPGALDLLHEMKVAHMELEIQSEELKRAQDELASLHREYKNLYEFAPCGYVTLNPRGIITKANLTAVSLLNASKNSLFWSTLSNYIAPGWEAVFLKARKQAAHAGEKQSVELPLNVKSEPPVWVQVDIDVQMDEHNSLFQYRVVLMDITERKQAEKALQKSEQKFKQWFESSPISLWDEDFSEIKKCIDELKARDVGDLGSYLRQRPELVWELAGKVRVLDVNQATLNLYRAKSKEEFFCGITKVFSRESLEGFLQVLEIIADGERTFVTEKEHVTLDGEFLKVQLYWAVAKGHEETYSRILVSVVDITERKKAEEALRESEERFSLAMQATRDGVWDWDISTGEAYFSPGYAKALGYDPPELPADVKIWLDLIHPDDKQKAYQANKDCIDNFVDSFSVEFRMQAKSGEWVWILGRGSAVQRDESGQALRMIGTHTDITERKQAEEALHESEQRFRILLKRLPAGVFAHDLEGRILFVNDMACKTTGYAKEELLNMTVSDIDPESITRKDNISFWPRLRHGESTVFESRHVRKDGSWYPVEIHLNAVELQGRPVILPIVLDITERRHLEKQLKEMSIYDSLTDLYNRNFFEEEMNRLSDGRDSPLGIIVCDLDGMKFVNDTLGHQAGDELLKNTASILRQNFRSSDIVARIGGDEFAVLLPQTESETVNRMLQRMHEAVQEYNSTEPDLPLALSMGYAVSNMTADLQALFREADNMMYREKLQKEGSQRSAILQALTKTMQARDFDTEGHCDRLQELSTLLARSLGHSYEFMNDLCLLARFHDLGKVGIPDHILFKQGILTEEEWEQMRKHCEIGHRIASSVPELKPIADWILKHHEHWDGTGYPLGLKGEEIPIECRILAIIDAYDAMTSDRPYHKAVTKEEAISEFKRCAGTRFDPHLVEKFIQILLDSE